MDCENNKTFMNPTMKYNINAIEDTCNIYTEEDINKNNESSHIQLNYIPSNNDISEENFLPNINDTNILINENEVTINVDISRDMENLMGIDSEKNADHLISDNNFMSNINNIITDNTKLSISNDLLGTMNKEKEIISVNNHQELISVPQQVLLDHEKIPNNENSKNINNLKENLMGIDSEKNVDHLISDNNFMSNINNIITDNTELSISNDLLNTMNEEKEIISVNNHQGLISVPQQVLLDHEKIPMNENSKNINNLKENNSKIGSGNDESILIEGRSQIISEISLQNSFTNCIHDSSGVNISLENVDISMDYEIVSTEKRLTSPNNLCEEIISMVDDINSDKEFLEENKTSRCIPYIKENKQPNLIEPSESFILSGITELVFPYICHIDNCQYKSIEVSDLLLHFLVHHSPAKNEIECSICCSQFNLKSYHDLMNHICNDHYHKERQMVACSVPLCGRVFNRIHELVEHLTYFHDEINNTFPCSFCFAEQIDSISFENHIRTHFKNILICSYCSTSFDERDLLISHIEAIHPGQAKKISTFLRIINHERLKNYKDSPKMVFNKNLETENIEKSNIASKSIKLNKKSFDKYDDLKIASNNQLNVNEKINDNIKGPNENKKSPINNLSNLHIKNALNDTTFYSKKLTHHPLNNDHMSLLDKNYLGSIDTFSEYIEVPNLDRPDIPILKPDKGMKENCSICSYSCNTSIEMHDHHLQCHMNGFNGRTDILAPFRCRLCCTQFQMVDHLLDHLAHHWGKHVLRYYSCLYCSDQSDRMQVIEDHLGVCHADKRFKFEVNQESVNYLQGMLKCPKCEAVFKWKSEFINHLDKDHKLKKCVEFLENEYTPCTKLDNIFIPAHIIDSNEGLSYPTQPLISQVKSISASHMINDLGISIECNSKYSAVTDNSSPIIFEDQLFPKHKAVPIDNFQINKIPPSISQMNCHLCPFTCNKMLNFQKHMMIHERASNLMEGFKCSYCEFAHDRINCIKFHLSKYHADRPIKFCRISKGKEMEIESNDEILRPSYKNQMNRNLGITSHAFNRRYFNNNTQLHSMQKFSNNVISSFPNKNYQYNPVPLPLYDGIILGQTIDNDKFDSAKIKAEPITEDAKINQDVIKIINQVKKQSHDNIPQMVNQNHFFQESNEFLSMRPEECSLSERANKKRNKWSACWEYSFASGFKPYSSNFGFKLPNKRKWLKSRGPSYLSGIGKDYLQSNLPPGMIYEKPVKCPECEFRNRVRVNLVRHIKAMHPNTCNNDGQENKLQIESSYSATPKIKKEFIDSSVESHNINDSHHSINGEMDESNHSNQGTELSDGNTSFRKVYECAYCKMTSKWNRRDISLHILHTHMRRRVYTCNYCEFGSSKSPELVVQHTEKYHPDQTVSVNDCLSIFNAISTVNEGVGSVQLVYIKPNIGPLWTLQELEEEFGVKSSSRPVSADSRSRSVDLPAKKKIKLENGYLDSTRMNDEENEDEMRPPKTLKKMFYEWQCSLCGLTSSKSFRIKHHLIFHHLKLKPFSCPICRIYRWRKEQIEDHMSLEHANEIPMAISTVEEKAGYIKSYMKKVRVNLEDDLGYSKLLQQRNEDPTGDIFKKPFPTFYRCLLCNFEEQRHDKTKYHVIKQHLKIGLFSCPFCKLYQWSRPSIERHIAEIHPGKPIVAKRTFDEFSDYFTSNIQKISTKQFRVLPPSSSPEPIKETSIKRRSSIHQNRRHSPPGSHTCRKCGYIAETETALVSHTRVHRLYACGYCDFSNNLAAKVQIHCASQHPDLPARHIQMETNDMLAQDGQMEEGVDPEKQKMLVCRICNFIAWDEEMASNHALESHESKTPDFDLIEKSQTDLNGSNMNEIHDQNSTAFTFNESRNVDSEKEDEAEGIGKPGIDFLYHCCFCNMYQSNKVTVMRHHVMSHLHYQPYRCPYCPSAWSVKSSPITKHVKTKHPEKDAVFDCVRDETLESKVRAGFKRVPVHNNLIPESSKIARGGSASGQRSKSARAKTLVNNSSTFTIPLPTKKSHLHRKTYYRCSICGLGTRIKTDMRHHLMREVQYKPYRCLYCGYTEPSKSSMGKHFRVKHPGEEQSISEERDANQDAEVEKMLDSCQVGYNPSDKKKRWTGKSLRSRRYGKAEKAVVLKQQVEANLLEDDGEVEEDAQMKEEQVEIEMNYDNSQMKPRLTSADLLATIKGPPFECPHCTYFSSSIKPLQAHLVHHTPHRYKCGYCQTRSHYPSWMMKHIKKKHPGKTMKMVSIQLDGDAPIPKTVRRHHSKRRKLTMNLRNCNSTGRQFKSRAKLNGSSDDNETIPDDDDEVGDGILSEVDDGITDETVERKANFKLREVTVLVKPLRYPRIEVLPDAMEGDVMLQRCGFCSYETFSTRDFRAHVKRHTDWEPVRCAKCNYASFEVADVDRHWGETHGEEFGGECEFVPLTQPYSMEDYELNRCVNKT